MSGITAREVLYKIIGNTDEFVKGFDKADKQIDEFNKKTKATDKILSDIAKKSSLATTAIIATGVAVGKLASDFNTALAPVETLIPGQTARVNELKASIQELSPAVRKATDDLASGAYNIISAYGDADDTIQKLEISAKAASAGVATTNDSINLLSAVTKAYGDTSAEAQGKVADLAFVTLRNGQTTFPELATSIQRVTSLSAELKVSQAELFAVYSSGTGVIGGAAEVSTKMAAAQSELLKGTDTLTAAYKALGVTTGSQLIQKFGGFQGALSALKGYAEETGQSITNLFGSVQAGQIALYLTGEGAEKFTRDLKDMEDASGALDTAFKASTEGINKFADGVTQARLNTTVFFQRLGDEVLNDGQGFLDIVVNITQGLSNLDKGTLQTLISVGKIAATTLSTTAALAGLTKGIMAARTAMMALSAFAAANPVGLAVIALTTAVVAYLEISKRMEKSYEAEIEASRKYVNQLDQERIYYQKSSQENKKRADDLSSLITKYEELSEEAKTNEKAQSELQKVVKQIGSIAPEAITQWDEYGNALMINAEKVIEAQRLLKEASISDLAHSVDIGNLTRASLEKQAAELEKWNNENREKAFNGEKRAELENINELLERHNSRNKLITESDADFYEKNKLLTENYYKAITEAASAGYNISNPAELINISSELKKEVQASDKLLEKYNLNQKRIKEIKESLGNLLNDEVTLDTLTAPAPEPPADTRDKEKSARLKELDESYKLQKQLAQKNGEDIYEIEKEHQDKRLNLLKTFISEDVSTRAAGVSFATALNDSLQRSLADGYGNITKELSNTREKLKELSSEGASIEIDASVSFLSNNGFTIEDALRKISEDAKKAADSQLNNMNELSKQQVVFNSMLLDSNLSEESAGAIRSRLIAITDELSESENKRTESLAMEEEASRRLLDFDLQRIEKTAQETEDAIIKELEFRKELGLFGDNEKEIKRNTLSEKYNLLLTEQNALMNEYSALISSGSDADKKRAEALKTEIKEIGALAESINKEIENSSTTLFERITKKIAEVLSKTQELFTSLSNVMTGLIDNSSERKAQEYANRLTEIEREKNAVIGELETELNDIKEEHRLENEEREAEYQQRLYDAQMAEYERNLTELQGSFAQETNIEKLRELEKQIEAEKKKKREAQEQKKKEQEDKKREEEQLKRENEILNQRNQMEWEYQVAQIETENAAGTAAANAAIEKARWEKSSTALMLTLKALENTVQAASSWPNVAAMAIYSAAATLSAASVGVALASPEPAPYNPQPLPAAPRKLADGGIFMPSAGGTAILLASGNPAITAEAGVPELYLPITPANIESLFKAAGVKNINSDSSFVYAPVYELNFSDNQGSTKEEVFDYLKNEVSRDLLEVVEDAKRKFYVGE